MILKPDTAVFQLWPCFLMPTIKLSRIIYSSVKLLPPYISRTTGSHQHLSPKFRIKNENVQALLYDYLVYLKGRAQLTKQGLRVRFPNA